jgi:hypothetical protein
MPSDEELKNFEKQSYKEKPKLNAYNILWDKTTYDTGTAVIIGLKLETYFVNSTNCFERYMTWQYEDYPALNT